MFQMYSKQWIVALCFFLIPATTFAEETQVIKEEAKPIAEETKSVAEKAHILSPIVVTANKREESIQEIPASISALDSTQIEDFRIEKMADIFNATPNIYMTKTGPSAMPTPFGSVRGIVSSMGGSQVLGIYVDNVYQPHLDMNLLDVERVEVLRGPQGTLYGRNTEAGVINIVTKQPTNIWEGKAGVEYGSYNTFNFNGIISGPIIEDKLLFRLSGNYNTSDNYFTNNFDDDKDVSKNKDVDLRFRVTSDKEESFRVALTFDLQDYWSGGYTEYSLLGIDKGYEHINMDYDGYADKQAMGVSLHTELDFYKATLHSITSFRTEQSKNSTDTDFRPLDLTRMKLDYDNTSFNQELRLASNDATAPYKWLVGAFAFYEEYQRDIDFRMNFTNLGWGPAGLQYDITRTNTDTTGIAFFAQGSYTFWDRLELTAGLRYDYLYRIMDYDHLDPMAMGGAATKGKPGRSFDAWLPKVALSYKVNDSIRPYVSISRGYREGGFNFIAELGEEYDSEYTWNYELGVKTQWFDNRLLFNVALFYIEWEDKQVETPAAGATVSSGTWYFENAGSATSQGIEAEFTAYPIDGLEIMGSFGYTQAKYTEYEGVSPGPTGFAYDYSNKYIVDVPKYTVNLAGIYRFENGIYLSASYNYIGKIYYDRENDISQNGYNIVDAKVGYKADHFEIYAFADNLFNESYYTRGIINASFPAADNVWYGRPGEPQTFGIGISASF